MSLLILKRTFIPLFLVLSMLFYDCVRANKNCKADHKKAKKNNIGWKY